MPKRETFIHSERLSIHSGSLWPGIDMKSETDTHETAQRYGAIETSDGDLVIYDRDNTTAWLQSNHTVDVSA